MRGTSSDWGIRLAVAAACGVAAVSIPPLDGRRPTFLIALVCAAWISERYSGRADEDRGPPPAGLDAELPRPHGYAAMRALGPLTSGAILAAAAAIAAFGRADRPLGVALVVATGGLFARAVWRYWVIAPGLLVANGSLGIVGRSRVQWWPYDEVAAIRLVEGPTDAPSVELCDIHTRRVRVVMPARDNDAWYRALCDHVVPALARCAMARIERGERLRFVVFQKPPVLQAWGCALLAAAAGLVVIGVGITTLDGGTTLLQSLVVAAVVTTAGVAIAEAPSRAVLELDAYGLGYRKVWAWHEIRHVTVTGMPYPLAPAQLHKLSARWDGRVDVFTEQDRLVLPLTIENAPVVLAIIDRMAARGRALQAERRGAVAP